MVILQGSRGTRNVLRVEGVESESYEERILQENQFIYLLNMTKIIVDSNKVFEFKIDGLMPLSDYFHRFTPGWMELFKLLSDIKECMQEMQQYLLDPGHLILDFRWTFFDKGKNKFMFAVLAGTDMNFAEQIKRLLEEMMTVYTRDNKEDAFLLYEFYAKVLTDNYSPDLFCNDVNLTNGKATASLKNSNEGVLYCKEKNIVSNDIRKNRCNTEGMHKNYSEINLLNNKANKPINNLLNSPASNPLNNQPNESANHASDNIDTENCGYVKNVCGNEDRVLSDEKCKEHEDERKKVIGIGFVLVLAGVFFFVVFGIKSLKFSAIAIGGYCVYLIGLMLIDFKETNGKNLIKTAYTKEKILSENAQENGSNINFMGNHIRCADRIYETSDLFRENIIENNQISKMIPVNAKELKPEKLLPGRNKIGRKKSESDIIIDNPGISRVHAEIFISENEIKIEDLGSTNGTYLNNTKLDKGVPAKAHYGDEISFADSKFYLL